MEARPKQKYRVTVPERLKPFPGREEAVDQALKEWGGVVQPEFVVTTSAKVACVIIAYRLEGRLKLPPRSILAESFVAEVAREPMVPLSKVRRVRQPTLAGIHVSEDAQRL